MELKSESKADSHAGAAVFQALDLAGLDWDKVQGLMPAVVQHADSREVLMLGYMNRDALACTLDTGRVTFFSRSKHRLWTKGETSGNVLELVAIGADCDQDTLLVLARPRGPVCHRGTPTCFDLPVLAGGMLARLDALIARRERERPAGSYTTRLLESGIRRIAQKLGEEGVETALAAVSQDDDALLGEAADLLFHLLVLLRARGLGLARLEAVLAERHRTAPVGSG